MATHKCHCPTVVEPFHVCFCVLTITCRMPTLALINSFIGYLNRRSVPRWRFAESFNVFTNLVNRFLGKVVDRVVELGAFTSALQVPMVEVPVDTHFNITTPIRVLVTHSAVNIKSYSFKGRPKTSPEKQAGQRCCNMRAHSGGVDLFVLLLRLLLTLVDCIHASEF